MHMVQRKEEVDVHNRGTPTGNVEFDDWSFEGLARCTKCKNGPIQSYGSSDKRRLRRFKPSGEHCMYWKT